MACTCIRGLLEAGTRGRHTGLLAYNQTRQHSAPEHRMRISLTVVAETLGRRADLYTIVSDGGHGCGDVHRYEPA